MGHSTTRPVDPSRAALVTGAIELAPDDARVTFAARGRGCRARAERRSRLTDWPSPGRDGPPRRRHAARPTGAARPATTDRRARLAGLLSTDWWQAALGPSGHQASYQPALLAAAAVSALIHRQQAARAADRRGGRRRRP
jgi:hypothetical protein